MMQKQSSLYLASLDNVPISNVVETVTFETVPET